MSHPTPLFLWFTHEIRGVGRTAEACCADAHRRCRSEHAACAAEIAPQATPEPVEAWLAALEAGTVVELRVHGDAERAREVVCARVHEHSPVIGWWLAPTLARLRSQEAQRREFEARWPGGRPRAAAARVGAWLGLDGAIGWRSRCDARELTNATCASRQLRAAVADQIHHIDPWVYRVYLVNMPGHSEHQVIEETVRRLAELLGQAPLRVEREPCGVDLGVDARVEFPNRVVLIKCKGASDVAAVAGGVRALAPVADGALPLLVVPYMGDAGRRVCEEAGVSWLDLSGNAHIVAPGLRVVIEGRPNLFKRAGRPSTAFAPKSARIARWLLMHPRQPATQQEIADATQMDRGFTSRIVRRLIDDELVERTEEGRVVASWPDRLLEAWAEQYDWNEHRVHSGVVAARSGAELTTRLAEGLFAAGVEHAFTGLVAAWQYDHFATYRLAAVYLPAGLPGSLLASLGVRQGERGANTWLVVPNDQGVLHGAADVGGIPCVHPVQVWLDLAAHPERAPEAREHLRREHLRWNDA